MNFEINLTQIAIALIAIVFTGVIIPSAKAFFAWLVSKTKNEGLISAINEAQFVVDNVIANMQVNVVDALKEASADGKLTAEEIKQISSQSFDMFLSDISSKSLDTIMANADDVSEWVANLISSRLSLKKIEEGIE